MEDKRNVQLHFRVTRREKKMIDQKMAQMGTERLGVYLRKMALDGYVVKLELADMKELLSLVRYAGNNLNQLAKRANERGQIFDTDIDGLKEEFARVQESLQSILLQLSNLR